MPTEITLRRNKSQPLTFDEVDNNFENLKATADAAATGSGLAALTGRVDTIEGDYTTAAQAEAIADDAIADHVALPDPHSQYLTGAESVSYAATKAAADSLAASLPDGATVVTDRDETAGGVQTRRVVTSGVLGAPVNELDAGQVKYESGTVADKLAEIVAGAATQVQIDESIDAHNDDAGAHPILIAAAEGFADQAESARDAALLSRGLWQTIAQGIGNGVAGTDSLIAGSGGTNGTFALAFSGGTQVIAPKGYFVVAGGAVTQVAITYAGHYSAGTPTLSFAASAGLTGASATAVMGANTQVGEYFSVPVADSDDSLILYRVDTGPVATEITRYPSSTLTANIPKLEKYAAEAALYNGFSPGALFLTSGIAGHLFDPNDKSTLFQDSGATTPVTATGQTVARIDDFIGDRDLNTATGSWTYEEDENGGYLSLSTGGGGFHGAAGYSLAAPIYCCFAVRPSVAGAILFTIGTATTNRFYVSQAQASYTIESRLRNATANIAQLSDIASGKIGAPIVVETWLDGVAGTISIAINGGPVKFVAASNLADGGMTNFRIGFGGAGIAAGGIDRIYGGLIYKQIPNDTVRRSIVEYYMQRAGLFEIQRDEYDMFLVAGQSNAVGTASDFATSTPPNLGEGAEFVAGSKDTKGAIFPLYDPVRQNGVLASSRAATGSAWPAFAKKYFEDTGRKVIIVGGALSGNGLTTGGTSWAPDTLLDQLVTRSAAARNALIRRGGVANLKGILWLGGEADATAGVTKAVFKAAFADLLVRFRAKLQDNSVKIYALSIDSNSNVSLQAGFAEIRDALSESAAEVEGIELVMPYQDFLTSGNLSDGLHWDQTALNAGGTIAGENTAALLP